MDSTDTSTALSPYILIADDEEMSLTLLLDGLKGMGFQTGGCKSGKEAILLGLKRLPDAILLDDKMPGLDSMKTIKLIRIMEPLRPLPVILMAESPNRETVLHAIQMGANDCVSKEASIHDIGQRILRALKLPPREITPLYSNLSFFFYSDGDSLTLDIESDITSDSGRSLVELVRNLTGLMPVRFCMNMEKVVSIAASGVGYLSDVKDTVTNCGGTITLAHVDLSRYLPNVRRVLEKYFRIEADAAAAKK